MDLETYVQPAIPRDVLGDSSKYIKEGMQVKLTFYEGEPLDVEIPLTVDMEIVEAEIALRGDTATGVTKKVVTETGLEVQVPSFVDVGDVIRVNTSDGSYITRV
jgi:elongation factor P